ncbi:MAG: serine/threonine protein kinase [Clostridiales Family XIII bacterium]|nr:serine/threonine protein kinase [Clostridiales Family XIII bacterium]
MDSKTAINFALHGAPKTEINDEIDSPHARQIGDASSSASALLDAGTVLCGAYTVERRLKVSSGEADLYLCSHENGRYVAKLYKRRAAIKQDVIERLLQIDSPYVARLFASSTHDGFPVEILRYYANGSLQGRTYTYDELVRRIIPNINEGLHALHRAGIIHKDLKPSNIMLADDGKSVAITDFGISSVMSDAGSVVLTKTGMTPEYSAPETFKNLFLEESDYYSFGITLFELFTGYAPYANMSAEEIGRYVSVQRIPFPGDMPTPLSDFISALTYYDITSRANKNNPNRRWTYSEVKRWLEGENLVIPGEGAGPVGKGAMPPYRFMDETISDPRILAEAFAKNWKEGKKHLFRGLVSAHFRVFDQEMAAQCMAAEEEASKTNGRDDLIFWKLLYRLNPSLKGFYWKDRTFESLPALGRDLLDRLWKKDRSLNKYCETVLAEKLLTEYVALAAPNNEALKNAAAALEESYRIEKTEHTDLVKTFYLMAYTLSGQKLLNLDGRQFRTVGEFAGYMRERLEESLEAFERLCHKLVDYDGKLDVQLEAWLIAIGKKNELENWRALMRE